MKPLDLRTSSYFSMPFKFAAVIILAAGLTLLFVNLYIGVAAVVVGIVILTTHYRLTIDLQNSSYHDYLWILGLKSGEKGKFDLIQYVFINKNKVSETMHSRAHSSTFVRDEYNGYLKLSERKKIHLASDEDKTALVHGMRRISQQLNCDLLDYTTGVATRI